MPLEGIANLTTLRGNSSSELPVALSALVAVSNFKKSDWEAVIKEYRLPIEVRRADPRETFSESSFNTWRKMRNLENE